MHADDELSEYETAADRRFFSLLLFSFLFISPFRIFHSRRPNISTKEASRLLHQEHATNDEVSATSELNETQECTVSSYRGRG